MSGHIVRPCPLIGTGNVRYSSHRRARRLTRCEGLLMSASAHSEAPALPAASTVLAEITAGKGLTLVQAASRYPATRGTGRLHSSTLWRWIRQGIVAANGSRV